MMLASVVIMMLLLRAGIESNPGPDARRGQVYCQSCVLLRLLLLFAHNTAMQTEAESQPASYTFLNCLA